MQLMFFRAQSFNQPVGHWNTSAVNNMSRMFEGAESFNQPLGNWQVEKVELSEVDDWIRSGGAADDNTNDEEES